MCAKKLENIYAHDRHLLHEVVPLDTPYAISIEPSALCNIKCVYCLQSLPRQNLQGLGFDGNYFGSYMSDETFDLLLDQLCEFPQKIASITFGGVGEPLMHKKLPEMIAKVKAREITNRINLVTNGLLLTKEKSLALIEAGLTSMKISLQGIDEQAYLETCGHKLDLNAFLDNLAFLYQNRGQCKIGIKVADIALFQNETVDREQQTERYREMFSDKCDQLGIESIVPLFSDVDYDKVKGMSGRKCRYDIEEREVKVCTQPFYRLNILQSGCVTLCTTLGLHEEGMNVRHQTLKQIWNGETRKRMLLNNLRGECGEGMERCKGCGVKFDFTYKEDDLDPYAEEVAERILNAERKS